MSTLPQSLTDLLATLRAIHWHAWSTHWKAKGSDAYSDHLLFQRIYSGDGGGPKIDDQIDGLGERIIGLFGNSAVDPAAVAQKAVQIQKGIAGLGMIAGALSLEKAALGQAARVADLVAKGPAALRIGLDNFVRELADARSTVIYLLQQRLKGGSDSYGDAMNSTFSPYVSALFPVVLSAGVGGLIAGTTGRWDPKQGAMAGASLGVIWSVLQMSKQDEVTEIVVAETAKQNNVFKLADHPNFGAAEVAEESGKLSSFALLGLIGMVALLYSKNQGSGVLR